MKVIKVAHHRNGVAGNAFGVVLFRDDDKTDKVGIVFDVNEENNSPWERSGNVAVLGVQLLADGCIEFGENSWRGDQYETFLRTTCQRHWPWAECSPEAGIPPGTPDTIRHQTVRRAADLLMGVHE